MVESDRPVRRRCECRDCSATATSVVDVWARAARNCFQGRARAAGCRVHTGLVEDLPRQRFVRFFGSDLIVLPGEQVQVRMGEYWAFCREVLSRPATPGLRHGGEETTPLFELPPDLVDTETVALIYDEVDGLGSMPSSIW
jgi:hypothetical protein